MINKIDNTVSDILKDTTSSTKPSSTPEANSGSPADASLQVSVDSVMQQASQVPESANAVEEARQLLLSGKLDTPENIRSAAESMLKYGV